MNYAENAVNKRYTKKGEVYWIAAKDAQLLAYRYTTGGVMRTRYKIKCPEDTRARWVSVRQLLKEYPFTFSILRNATGTKEYDL